MNSMWVENYLPMIKEFTKSFESIDKKVVLVISNHYRNVLEESTQALRLLYKMPCVEKNDLPDIYGVDV